MILLDPDLDPDPAPRAKPARSAARQEISTRSLELFLRKAQAAVRLRGEVSVLLTTDRAMRRLNRRFRGKDKATDVLSFPADTLVQRQEKGDLAISVETARRQGAAHGHSLGTEIRILILHGLLHLNGFDHESDDGRMARRERVLRARLGLEQGLIERATVSRKGRTADPSTSVAKATYAQDDNGKGMRGGARGSQRRSNARGAR